MYSISGFLASVGGQQLLQPNKAHTGLLVPISNGMRSVFWVGGLFKSRSPEWLQLTMPVARKLPISNIKGRV